MSKSARVLLLAALCACSKQHPSASGAGPRILRHIPADTPYVFASLEPVPRDYLEISLRDSARDLPRAVALLRGQNLGPAAEFLAAFLEEVAADPTLAGLEKLGLSTKTRAAFYGLGLMPAMRLEVRDTAVLGATFERAMKKSGFQPPVETHRGRKMWVVRMGPVAIAWGFSDGDLVGVMAPAEMLPRMLDLLFGEARLGPSLADTGELEKLSGQNGWSRHMLGWIDFRNAFKVVSDEKQPLARDQLKAFGATAPSPECLPELLRFASISPRMSLGGTQLSASNTSFGLLMELDPLVARELMAIRTPVPGVGARLDGGVFSFGVAVDVGKLIGLIRRGVTIMKLAPYRCDVLDGVNKAVSELDRDLGTEVPGWIKELRGFAVVLESVEAGLAFPSVKAHGLIAASDPIQLIDLAKRTISSLSGMQIPPDGRPVPLPGGVLPLMTGHVAMKGQLLGMSIGSGSELQLQKLMSTPPLSSQPVAAFAVDGEKMEAVMKLIKSATGDKDEDTGAFGRGVTQITVEVTERGLMWRGTLVRTGR